MAAVVQVEILGQKFMFKSEDGEGHVREVAAYVDEKMREVGGEGSVPPYTRAILVALNIASECQKLRQSQAEVERVVGRITNRLDQVPPAPDEEEISERA
jgi:cell division protein ZapA (FtsZ GTPase activity inhibitor)